MIPTDQLAEIRAVFVGAMPDVAIVQKMRVEESPTGDAPGRSNMRGGVAGTRSAGDSGTFDEWTPLPCRLQVGDNSFGIGATATQVDERMFGIVSLPAEYIVNGQMQKIELSEEDRLIVTKYENGAQYKLEVIGVFRQSEAFTTKVQVAKL